MAQQNTPSPRSQVSDRSDAAFLLSLIGGILIEIGSVVGMGLLAIGRPFYWGTMMSGYSYMMDGYYYYGSNFGWMYGFDFLGAASGVLVIVFALLRSKPADTKALGSLIVVFSFVSLAAMGGFFIGAILGIVGGILALAKT